MDGPRHSRRPRSPRRVVGAVVVVMAAGLRIALVLLVWHPGRSASSATAAPPPRFTEEASAAGIDHTYAGDFEFFVGGGVAAFDCDDDGRDDLFFAGGSEPRRALPQREPGWRRAPLHPADIADHRPDCGHWRLPARRRRRRTRRPRGSARVEATSCCAGLATAGSRTPTNRSGIDAGDRLDGCVQRDVGRLERATDSGVRQLPRARQRRRALTVDWCGPAPTGDAYATPIALTPGYCTLSMLFSDWSRSGQRDLRMTNDRHYYTDGEEQLWRIAPSDGAAPSTPTADGWRPIADLGHGHRQPGRDRRRLSRGVRHEPGRQQAADARGRRGAADVPRHRPS